MQPTTYKTATTTTKPATRQPVFNYNSKVPSMRNIYYYHPRDLIEIGSNSISGKKYDNSRMYENLVWRKLKALRVTSSSTALQISFPLLILLPLLKFWCMWICKIFTIYNIKHIHSEENVKKFNLEKNHRFSRHHRNFSLYTKAQEESEINIRW